MTADASSTGISLSGVRQYQQSAAPMDDQGATIICDGKVKERLILQADIVGPGVSTVSFTPFFLLRFIEFSLTAYNARNDSAADVLSIGNRSLHNGGIPGDGIRARTPIEHLQLETSQQHPSPVSGCRARIPARHVPRSGRAQPRRSDRSSFGTEPNIEQSRRHRHRHCCRRLSRKWEQ